MPPCVKHLLSTQQACTRRRAPLRSLRRCAESNQDSASNQLQVELDPTHASLRSTIAIMIASSNSLFEGSGLPNRYLGVFTAHQRLFRAGPRADRKLSTAGNPIACATSRTD